MIIFCLFLTNTYCTYNFLLQVVEHITATNDVVVSSEELMLNVLRYILATNPIETRDTLFVLTVPSATTNLHDANRFLKSVAKQVNENHLMNRK